MPYEPLRIVYVKGREPKYLEESKEESVMQEIESYNISASNHNKNDHIRVLVWDDGGVTLTVYNGERGCIAVLNRDQIDHLMKALQATRL